MGERLCPYCGLDPMSDAAHEAIKVAAHSVGYKSEMVDPGGRVLHLDIGTVRLHDYCYWCDLSRLISALNEHHDQQREPDICSECGGEIGTDQAKISTSVEGGNVRFRHLPDSECEPA